MCTPRPTHPFVLARLLPLTVAAAFAASAAAEEIAPPDAGRSATMLASMGSGDDDAAAAAYRTALRIRETTLGPEHPETRQVREAHTAALERLDAESIATR